MLFSRQALIRQGIIIRQGVAIYDRNGDLVDKTITIKEASQLTSISENSISTALKSEKMSKDYFFRHYNLTEEPAETIKIDYVCDIDGIHFITQSEVADYCGVSRQAVSGSRQRKSKAINGKEIIWNIDLTK